MKIIFLSETQVRKTDFGTSNQEKASAAASGAEQLPPVSSEPSQASKRNRKQRDRFGEPIAAYFLKKSWSL